MLCLSYNTIISFSEGGNVQFNTININSNSCWFDSFNNEDVIELQQLEKDTIFVATPCIHNSTIMHSCMTHWLMLPRIVPML